MSNAHPPTWRLLAPAVVVDWPQEFERHRRWLRTVVQSRLADASQVDDVLQDVAVSLLRTNAKPTSVEHVGPWLYRAAVRRCLTQRRSAVRRQNGLGKLFAGASGRQPAETIDPLHWLLGRERMAAVRAALEQLAPIDREIFLLKHTEDWTYHQLAKHLGCSPHTIEHRLARVRQQLRRQLSTQGLMSGIP